MRATSGSRKPTPKSSSPITAQRPSSRYSTVECTISWRRSGGTSLEASTAFTSKFRRTCWSWIRSPLTSGRSGARDIFRVMPCCSSSGRTSGSTSPMTRARSQGPWATDARASSPRIRVITSAARSPSFDGGQRLSDAVQVGSVSFQPVEARVGVSDDRRQRLVDLMGDGGGELAQRRHPRDVREFLPRLVQRVLGPLALRARADRRHPVGQDRKSTRLNSSHGYISYAVFCLK